MFIKFENLPKEKKRKIIEVSLIEFGENGFISASTNNIVQKAGISKGALFNYFGNKKNLYFYLVDYCIKILEKNIFESDAMKETDVIKKMIEVSQVKLNIFKENRSMYNFLISFYKKTPYEIEEEFNKRSEIIKNESFLKLYENIDYSLFKEDTDIPKAMKILTWTIESFSEEKLKEIKRKFRKGQNSDLLSDKFFSNMMDELISYLDIFRKTFYK
ncbi:TetR/AcrR family transcriptional regulator [Helicovermis profundi]|uniref:TetR/AcrR family transcriptional regulator n=1 Tax=Helicovermis profundi TaxID=3065157 RepID=A0AAU9EFN1_9FIRM|nr:TetR/AcrR family transcriptional regulator [Clostridia bacterium S502]